MIMQMTKSPAKLGPLALLLVMVTSLAAVSVSHAFWQQKIDNLLRPQAAQDRADNMQAFGMKPLAHLFDELSRRR